MFFGGVNLQYCLNCNYHCNNHIFFEEVLLSNTQVTLKLLHWLNMIMFQPRICETVSPPRKHWNSTYLPPWHYGIRRERSFPRISQVFYINSIKITLILISTLNRKSSMTCWNQLVTISLDNPCCILHWEISLYHYGWKITR